MVYAHSVVHTHSVLIMCVAYSSHVAMLDSDLESYASSL